MNSSSQWKSIEDLQDNKLWKSSICLYKTVKKHDKWQFINAFKVFINFPTKHIAHLAKLFAENYHVQ